MNRESIFTEISLEREYQDSKWERKPGDWPRPNTIKLTVLLEEVGEVARAILEQDKTGLKKELIQVAAVVTAWLESFKQDDPNGKSIDYGVL